MKGGGGGGGGGVSSYSSPAKRGWRGLALAVLGLVILSMLVPLVFLLGLHNGFHSTTATTTGYVSEVTSGAMDVLANYDPQIHSFSHNQPVDDKSAHIDDLINRLEPSLPKEVIANIVKEGANDTVQNVETNVAAESMKDDGSEMLDDTKNKAKNTIQAAEVESGKSCEVEFGSYCHWSEEHKEDMKDSVIKKLKDQLFVARAYYPSIAKLPSQDELSREMKLNIQEFERILSESTTDVDLPPHIEKKSQRMEAAITKAKSLPVECHNVDKKLRQILDLSEDEAHFHMKQSVFLYQLAVQTMPKSLHCLSMRLTLEYFRSGSLGIEHLPSEKFVDPELHHYVIFSKNVLASSVVINSTIMNAKENGNQVFHVLTDRQNYFAMKFWFWNNTYKEAAIQVLNIEDLNLNYDETEYPLQSSEEFRVSVRNIDSLPAIQMKTEYISIFGHAHFLLPEIFKNLKKVVVLGDDIVVQRDLSPLWSLDMEGKVNGAVQFCGVRVVELKSYLGDTNFDRNSCTWMSGLNMVNLERWREQGLTETYRKFQLQEKASEKTRSIGAMSATLLTFQNQVYSLDGSLVLSGLGHDYNIDVRKIKKATVLHYNGNMKPWLELGIPKYKGPWKKYLKREDQFMGECNVNP